jgi:hypothetical protein
MNEILNTEEWSEELEALVAASQHHKLLLENDFV